MRKYTGRGYTDVDYDDVIAMRLAAEWWADNASDDTNDVCKLVADRVEQALNDGDVRRANHEAAQWPCAAGPWH